MYDDGDDYDNTDELADDEDYDDEDYDDEACYHDHDENCEDYDGYITACTHQHCFACGGCQCPGYCDDERTYNLRFAETGGTDPVGVDGT